MRKKCQRIFIGATGIALAVGSCCNSQNIVENLLGKEISLGISKKLPLVNVWPEKILDLNGLRAEIYFGETKHDFYFFYLGQESLRAYFGHFENKLTGTKNSVQPKRELYQERFIF